MTRLLLPGGPAYDFVALVDWPQDRASAQTKVVANGLH